MGDHALEQWVAVQNIAKFREQLKAETDTCQREVLEDLLALEREKLKALSMFVR